MEYLVDNELVSFLRVVDKVPPQTAWLNAKHQKIFDHPLLEFRSANLINPGNVNIKNIFLKVDIYLPLYYRRINYIVEILYEKPRGKRED